MLSNKDTLDFLTGSRLATFRATSQNLAAVNPFFAENVLIDPETRKKVPGIPIGYCGTERSGGLFSYDEHMLYQAGIISDPNVKVFGKIGLRKSTLIKSKIYRDTPVGYCHLVTDRKGEYTPLANAIPGSKVLKFGSDANIYLNPLDPLMDDDTQLELLEAMTVIALDGHDGLDIEQKAVLWEAMVAAKEHYGMGTHGVPTLVEVVDKLFRPDDGMAKGMRRSVDYVADKGYTMGLALSRLTEKDLKGMFHKPTTPGLFNANVPLLVLNCEGVTGDSAVLMIMLLNFFTQSLWGRADAQYRFHRVIHDESWDLAAYPGFVESVRRAFKLGRTWGVANWIVAHHLGNLYRSGKTDAIKDLVADSSTTILFRQDEAELKRSAEDLGLNKTEVERIIKLEPGFSMWKINDRTCTEVEHVLWPEERELVKTDHLLLGQTPTS